VVSGYMGTRKTDFSLKMGEWLWLKDTRYIIGNIGVNIKDSIYSPYYFEVATLSELLKIIYRYKDSNKAFIFDEASIHISHRRAMSSKNNAITHLVKLIRKLKCHFVIISQRAEGIDKDLRELMTLHIHKESKTRALVREMFGEKPETYYIDCIEKTKIHFDTLDTADFEIDILSEDIPKIMHLISKNPSYEEFEQYIDELVKKKEEKDKKPNEYINRNNGKDENIQYNNTYQCDKRTDIEDKILTCLYMSDDGKKLRDIMKLIEKSKTRTHEILDSLKKKGLITLEGVGRQSKWIITDAGKYHVEKHLPHAN
jgi:predicted transcriptional regulator